MAAEIVPRMHADLFLACVHGTAWAFGVAYLAEYFGPIVGWLA